MKSFLAPLLALFLQGCSSLLYYPTHVNHFPPEARGYHPENVEFTSQDGTKLFGWLFRHEGTAKKPKALLVYYHGNGENISSHYLNLLWILKEGYDFFIFDYRGYGLSAGTPDPKGTTADGEAALRLMRARNPQTPLVIFAQSLGGAIALRNAIDLDPEIRPKAVVIESSFTSYERVGRRIMARAVLTWPFQWLPWLVLSDRYAPDGEIDRISPVPLLVMHADHDEIVPYACGEDIFAQAKEPKTFWKIPGPGHGDAFLRFGDEYRKKLLSWLDTKL